MPSINADKLESYLEKHSTLTGAVMVQGQEVLTAEIAIRALRENAKTHGIDEHQVIYLGKKINPIELTDLLDSQSLFSNQKLVEVRFESEKPSAKEAAKLFDVIPHVGSNIVIFECMTLENRIQKAAWLSKLASSCALTIQAPKIYFNRLPDWIAQRAKVKQVMLAENEVQKIAKYTQGNLMWAEQLLSQLTNPSNRLDILLDDQSRYGIFDLCDAVLKGDKNSYMILKKLLMENEPPTLLASMLNRDMQILLTLREESPDEVFKAQRVWQSKQALYLRAHQRLNQEKLNQALRKLSHIDRLNKGVAFGDVNLAFAEYFDLMLVN